MEATINERIAILKESLRLTDIEFCNTAKISTGTLHRIKNNSEVSAKVISSICENIGVSREWLVKGTGEMTISTPSEAKAIENPWRDALVEQLTDEIQFLRNALKLALGSKEANFLKAFDLAVPNVASKYIGIMPQMEVKSVSGAA